MVAERRIWRNLVGGVFSWLLAAIVGIGLHAQPDCVATTGFHNKVSTVPESPWPKLDVEQKIEIHIQICNRFSVTAFGTIFSSKMSLENRFKFEIWF